MHGMVEAIRENFIRYTECVVTRLINLDSEADRILSSVAGDYDGDAGRAVSELLIAHESIESFLDELEAASATELIRQRD